MPEIRHGLTRKFKIPYLDEATRAPRTLKFYLTPNVREDGMLGEIFIKGDQVGGFLSGALDTLAMAISVGLRHGVPLGVFTEKLRHHRFGPSGFTGDPEFPSCTSMFDLIAQYLDARFPKGLAADWAPSPSSSPGIVVPPMHCTVHDRDFADVCPQCAAEVTP